MCLRLRRFDQHHLAVWFQGRWSETMRNGRYSDCLYTAADTGERDVWMNQMRASTSISLFTPSPIIRFSIERLMQDWRPQSRSAQQFFAVYFVLFFIKGEEGKGRGYFRGGGEGPGGWVGGGVVGVCMERLLRNAGTQLEPVSVRLRHWKTGGI